MSAHGAAIRTEVPFALPGCRADFAELWFGMIIALIGFLGMIWLLAIGCAIIFAFIRRWRFLGLTGAAIGGLTLLIIILAAVAPPQKPEAITSSRGPDRPPKLKPTQSPIESTASPGPETDEDKDYMTQACQLMYRAQYSYDFAASGDTSENMRIVTCSDGDLVYFMRQHLAESKAKYNHDPSPPYTPGGYHVPSPGTADPTPIPTD